MGKATAILMVIALFTTVLAVFPAGISAAGAYTVSGEIKADKAPYPALPGITVTLVNTTLGINKQATTDASGKFTIPVYDKANYNMTYEDKVNYAYKVKHDLLMNSTFDDFNMTAKLGLILLEPLPILKGTVKDLTEMPLNLVEVTIRNGTTKEVIKMVKTNSMGVFSTYVDAPFVDIEYRKASYYANESLAVQVADTGETNVGTIYLELIEPIPTVKVWGVVRDDNTDDFIGDALVSISTGDEKWITARSNGSDGSYSIMTYPGIFQVKASKKGYLTNVSDDWLNVPSNKAAVRRNIYLTPTLPEVNTLTGNVDDGAIPVVGAMVTLYSTDGQYSNTTTTDGSGDYTIKYYNSTFKLAVEKAGFYTEVHGTDITAATVPPVDVHLTAIVQPRKIQGFVTDKEEETQISGAKVTLYDTTRLYSNTTTTNVNGHYLFMAQTGADLVLVVDADGYQSEAIDIVAGSQNKVLDVELVPSPKDTIRTSFTFKDWMNITVDVNQTITVDNVSARGDMDRRFEDLLVVQDWNLDSNEVNDWMDYLENRKVEERVTTDLLTLDNRHYELDEDSFNVVSIEGATGSVTGVISTIYLNSTYDYMMVGELDDVNASQFSLVLNASYDSATIDYVYDIYLPLEPSSFEMTSHLSETANVEVTGYNDPITVDTLEFIEESETVTMTIQRSGNGTAKAKVIGGFYYALNTTFDNYTVIVRMGAAGDGVNTTVTFSAEDSTDKVGDITKANFTWDFGDGTIGWGMEATHNYTTGGDMTVALTVNETGGNTTTRTILVKVDNTAPTARITVDVADENVTYASNTLTVNEDLELTFSGIAFSDVEGAMPQFAGNGASVDHITGSDGEGVIEKWYWSWGEEGVSNETVTKEGGNNISHTYATPGTYTLQMNVTDVVDHVSTNAIWTVRVVDITPPTPGMLFRNETDVVVTECIENKVFTFNASTSQDNADEAEDMLYQWDFDSDGTIDGTGFEVNWTFTEIGAFNVTLMANDTAGNSKNITQVVPVSLGDRPNLFMLYGTMDFGSGPGVSGEGSVGSTLTITVNITNTGQVAADNVEVFFYIRNADGTDTEIGSTSTTSIDSGGNFSASITWKPGKKGEYTIWANSTTPGEHSSQYSDNGIDNFEVQKVNIKEAGWVMPAIIGAVIAVIIVVFFGVRYFMSSRMESEEGISGKRKKR
jgi:hypothetical protein